MLVAGAVVVRERLLLSDDADSVVSRPLFLLLLLLFVFPPLDGGDI